MGVAPNNLEGCPIQNYQRIACWGDSQTFGARTYGCYPLHLVRELNDTTRYTWTAVNLSTNGHTARDLWLRLGTELMQISDLFRACVLIGANDVANNTPVDLFEEYYRQILDALCLGGIRRIHCGEIPPLKPDGHAFFAKGCDDNLQIYNRALRNAVADCANAGVVEFPDLDEDCYVDPAHFSELGNERVAAHFAQAIRCS